jgi:hypothetical protein
VSDEQGASARIEIALAKGQRFLDAQPGSPQDHDRPAQAAAVRPLPAARTTAMISSTLGGSPDCADLCCAAVDRRGSLALSSAIEADQRGQPAART